MRVYRYGCVVRGPLCSEAEEQFVLGHQFWNACVAIHRAHETERLEISNSASDAVARLVVRRAALDAEREEWRTRIRRSRQAAKGSVDIKTAQEQISKVNVERREVAAQLKAARDASRATVKPALHASGQAEQAEIKAMRQTFAAKGLFWPTYNAVLVGFDTARHKRLPDGRPAQVHFHRWDGSGFLAVQIRSEAGDTPLTWNDVMVGTSPLISVRMPETERETVTAKNGQTVTRKRMPILRLQVRGNKAKGPDGAWVALSPAWVEVPFVLHRQPDPEARVLGAHLVRRRVADRFEYRLCITVDETVVAPRSGPAVAVDLGWRRLPDGRLRVAYWVGEAGSEGQITVPTAQLDAQGRIIEAGGVERQMAMADAWESVRDRKFNLVRDRLATWLEAQETLPDLLREARNGTPARQTKECTHIPASIREWKSKGRLAALCLRWRDAPEGEEGAHTALEAWRRQDHHLWVSAAHTRAQAEARRSDAWRKEARALASRYAFVIIENMHIPDLVKHQNAEEGPASEGNAYRHAARIAAPGSLRLAIKQACAQSGATYREEDAAFTTRIHHACGQRVEQDYAAQTMVHCPVCSIWYDQDQNAAKNLLAYAGGTRSTQDSGVLAPRTQERPRGRFQREKTRREQEDTGGRSKLDIGSEQDQGM